MNMTTCDYQNDGQIITQPGKFQGEPVWVPEFWQAGLDGFADSDDGERWLFDVTRSNVSDWLMLAGIASVAIWEDSQGFVHAQVYPS